MGSKKTATKLVLNIDPCGEFFYLETEDGQILPNIVKCELPKSFPSDPAHGTPLVTVSFSLHDIKIKTTNITDAQ